MPRPLALGLFLAAAVWTTGCRDSTRPREVVAIYALQTVDGVPLPDVRQETPTRIELTARVLTLYDNGSMRDSSEYRETRANGVTITTSASDARWEDSGQRIILQYKVPEFFFGAVECHRNGDTLTCSVLAGAVFVYSRVP